MVKTIFKYFILTFIGVLSVYNTNNYVKEAKEEFILLNLSLNVENILLVLDFYGIQHSKTVLAQSVLETGYYSSKVCKEYNNILGLWDSKNKDYYKFNHWSECIKKFYPLVQYKYTGGCYYTWLKELPYAEDPEYVKKIKIIERRLSDKR